MHMVCNGSDCQLMGAALVHELVAARADIEARSADGRTPFLFAAATGVVDVAAALSVCGADVLAESNDGRNAADRAKGSSTQMTACPGP